MGKKKKSSSGAPSGRTRINPLTGQAETVAGTRSGRNKQLLPHGHPLRTHDLKPEGSRKKAHQIMMERNGRKQED